MQSVDQDELGNDHSGTLKVDGLPTVIAQAFHVKQAAINICCSLRQHPLEVREEGRVVQRPF
jgi:hypothetical protein